MNFDVDEVTSAINWALQRSPDIPEGQERHVTITGTVNVSGHDEKTGAPKTYRADLPTNMRPFQFTVRSQVSREEVKEWLDSMDTYFQNMLHVSDMVAVIENVSSLTINFRLIPEILGGALCGIKRT